ncbi:hypothetical protein BS47DRAFT_1114020 [Hydnum rufescens UP504]|uniref:Uncharacterized protein n=1 Tax=Hydnum rufescens UP504 TaxID=1448309 RepID=A0A9P6AB41_9AGAM|nr:hypothetical protein BS47DRAFT_1114020 [Hydnum rufescens UP504]
MSRILIAVSTTLNERLSDKCAPHRNLYPLVWHFRDPEYESQYKEAIGTTASVHSIRTSVLWNIGICIGMQILFALSTEPPSMDGLGIIDSPIGLFGNAGKPVPHMDLNYVALLTSGKENRARERVDTGMDEDEASYFVTCPHAILIGHIRQPNMGGNTSSLLSVEGMCLHANFTQKNRQGWS